MTNSKILVVEDERVVAADIEDSLRKLGYTVVGAAASGVSAIRRAVETEPDLVLMDIKLKGRMDGIDAATELHSRLGIPIVFLTAYADGEILDRAKQSLPYGYVLKPFDERALRSAVEIALHRHPRERSVAENERRLVTALRGFNEAVILTGKQGRITFMNQAAERLTGWTQADALGRRAGEVIVLLDSRRGSLRSDPVARVLQDGSGLGLGQDTVVVRRQGSEVLVEGTANPLWSDDREVVGCAVVFHAASPLDATAGEAHIAGRLELLGRLAGNFADMLSAALDSIHATAAEIGQSDGTDDALRQRLSKLAGEADEARQVATRLRTFSSGGSVRPKTVVINDVVNGLDRLLTKVAGRKCTLRLRLAEFPGNVSVDIGKIEQALLSLVLVGADRMPYGGRITIETDSVDLLREFAKVHTALTPGRYVVVSISYAGAVMVPAADSAAHDCPVVYEMVRSLSGDIVLRDEPGRRTSYDIYLPEV